MILGLMLTLSAAACSGPSGNGKDNGTEAYCNIFPAEYEVTKGVIDMTAFWRETRDNYGVRGETSHDGKLDYGVIENVMHTLKIDGKVVPTYATRCGFNIHAFAKIEVDTNADISIDAEVVLLTGSADQCIILPEKKGVAATISGNKAKATLNGYGDFTFVFSDKPEYALTVYVAEKTDFVCPDGYAVRYFDPGTYTREATAFTDKNTAYYFRKGVYNVTSITLPSDSELYFETGTFLKYGEPAAGDIYEALGSNGTSNIKVYGSGMFDFSGCVGGDAKTKPCYSFTNVDNIEVKGIISINSHNWSLCFWNCRNVRVSECMMFGYRTYSDGVMLSDCNGGYITDCFVRTGDDAMEVKSFAGNVRPDAPTDNAVVYENNTVWTDKANGYGVIYEANRNVSNVRFINNSIGFAQSNWSEYLGCTTVHMGTNKDARWENIYFENLEVFKTANSLCTLYNTASGANGGGQIRNIYFKNIKAKHTEQTGLEPFAINIIIKIAPGTPGNNGIIGNVYFNNISYAGLDITKENYASVSRVRIDEAAKMYFSNGNIKINTLN